MPVRRAHSAIDYALGACRPESLYRDRNGKDARLFENFAGERST